jgi:hypothetical protein
MQLHNIMVNAEAPSLRTTMVNAEAPSLSTTMVYTSPLTGFELTTIVVIGTDCTSSRKSNYLTITTTIVPCVCLRIVVSITHIVLCFCFVCFYPVPCRFSPDTPVSSTNKTDRHDIAEILLKVALNTISLNLDQTTTNNEHDPHATT